jgi:hypothetical protein
MCGLVGSRASALEAGPGRETSGAPGWTARARTTPPNRTESDPFAVEILRSLKTLQTINGKPGAEVLK